MLSVMSLDTVLVATGGEAKDLTAALARTIADIAGPAGAEVALAHVYTETEYEAVRDRLNFDPDGSVSPDTTARRAVAVRDLAEPLAAADIELSVHGRRIDGDSRADQFVALATELDADLLIVGGRDRSPVGKAVFGSTAQTVMLEAPCPVTYVRG